MLYKCVCVFFSFFSFLISILYVNVRNALIKIKKKTCKFYDFTSVGAFLPKIYKLVSFVLKFSFFILLQIYNHHMKCH